MAFSNCCNINNSINLCSSSRGVGKHCTKVPCLRCPAAQMRDRFRITIWVVWLPGVSTLPVIHSYSVQSEVWTLESRWCVGRNKTLALERTGFWSFFFYLKAVSPGVIYLPSLFLSFFIFSMKEMILWRVAMRPQWAGVCWPGARMHSLWMLGHRKWRRVKESHSVEQCAQ